MNQKMMIYQGSTSNHYQFLILQFKNSISKFSDGSIRILKPEIEPKYDSDDSDAENFNTIGNIPISAYDEMPHIGYDINGKRIMRPAKGSALDQLLESIDLPEGWTGLLDQNTGNSLKLTDEELELIRKIQQQENTDENINPYEPLIDWFTKDEEIMPVTAVRNRNEDLFLLNMKLNEL